MFKIDTLNILIKSETTIQFILQSVTVCCPVQKNLCLQLKEEERISQS